MIEISGFIRYIKGNSCDGEGRHLNDRRFIDQFDIAKLLPEYRIWLIERVGGGCRWSSYQIGRSNGLYLNTRRFYLNNMMTVTAVNPGNYAENTSEDGTRVDVIHETVTWTLIARTLDNWV